MNNLKRPVALFLAMLLMMTLLPTVARAEETGEDVKPATYADANEVFVEMISLLSGMATVDSDAQVREVVSGCAMYLLETHMGFMYVDDGGSDKDLFADDENPVIEYSVEPVYIDELDYTVSFDIYREEGYLCIESEAFDAKTNEQLDYLRFEIALREDTGERMLLFTRYEASGVLSSSNRYLVYNNGKTEKLLYSRTFGSELRYRIDLNAWAKGTDYTWNEKLLYPAIIREESEVVSPKTVLHMMQLKVVTMEN